MGGSGAGRKPEVRDAFAGLGLFFRPSHFSVPWVFGQPLLSVSLFRMLSCSSSLSRVSCFSDEDTVYKLTDTTSGTNKSYKNIRQGR